MRRITTNKSRRATKGTIQFFAAFAILFFGCASAIRGADVQINFSGVQSAGAVALAMLNNIKDNGLNSDPRINGGLGGLWINWRTGTKPLQVNFNGSRSPDGPKIDPARHDELTDLRYLHNLLSWKHQHPQDSQFDGELKRFNAIVKREFANKHNERGWIYDEFMDMWRLSNDNFFRDTARGLAEYYATKEIHADIGAIYKTS